MYSNDSRTPNNQDPLTHLDVKNAISKLKNGKAMGLDGLRVRLERQAARELLQAHFLGVGV